jgi:hypothetical protein
MLLASQIKPASPDAAALAKAIISLLEANKALKQANKRVPDYTGQYSHADYCAEEQQDWNNAAESLETLLLDVINTRIKYSNEFIKAGINQ